MKLAIAGVTGAVGQVFLKVLEKRDFPFDDLLPLASKRSVGKTVKCKGVQYEVEELTAGSFDGVDMALFSAGTSVSKEFVPSAVGAGAIVVDNSAAFRMDENVPLIIPEVNPEDVKDHKGIIANPNCSTIIALMALAPIHKVTPLKTVIVSTYQAVSGTGTAAMVELERQLRDVLSGKEPSIEVYPHQIAMNAIPHVDVFLDNGYTREEMKMTRETHKMLHDNSIRISTTCVRVPVMRCHSEAVTFQCGKAVTPDQVRSILADAPGVRVLDDPGSNTYPLATDVSGEDDVFVGRIRSDLALDGGISMWVVGDQLLKGAALNTIQIAELILEDAG